MTSNDQLIRFEQEQEIIDQIRSAQYEQLRAQAEKLWPKNPDLNPRTRREEAMIDIFCELIVRNTSAF